MTARKLLSTILLALGLSGCVVIPVEDKSATPSCKTYTKSMTLDVVRLTSDAGNRRDVGSGVGCGNDCLAALAAILAGSAVISGSIVLTNNTVHWLEYQGTCSDSYLYGAKQLFLESIGKPKPAS